MRPCLNKAILILKKWMSINISQQSMSPGAYVKPDVTDNEEPAVVAHTALALATATGSKSETTWRTQ